MRKSRGLNLSDNPVANMDGSCPYLEVELPGYPLLVTDGS